MATISFEDASVALGVAESTEVWGLATTDWNRDGCDDLYIGRHARLYPRLYRNDCPGPFTDEVGRLQLDKLPWRDTRDRHAPAWGDCDGDGYQDLFIPTGGGGGPALPPTPRRDVAGASLVIVNKDSAAFRDCYATVNREYRADRDFLLPAANGPGDTAIRLRLAEFSAGDRLLDWRHSRPSRLEVWCSQYTEFGGEHHGRLGPSDPDTRQWTDRPARWVGRL